MTERRDPSKLKTLDSFLDEEGIREEVTQTALARVEELKKVRSSGFYWVRIENDWTIAEWSSSSADWSGVLGYGDTADNVNDRFFNEVDERPISRSR